MRVEENAAATKEADGVSIHFLDIGQGDAAYVSFPNGKDMLIDCAKDARILPALSRVMDADDRVIDYLVPTHPDMDHYGGCIDVMKRFEIKHIVYSGYEKDGSGLYDSFWRTLQDELADGAEYMRQDHLQSRQIGGVEIDMLYPDHDVGVSPGIPGVSSSDESNNTSVIMRISYGGKRVLFTGDMGEDLETYLLRTRPNALDADILKVGHHGSAGSTSKEFLDAVTPAEAVISVGKENTYGHPSLRVLRKLERVGARVWRTDEAGNVRVVLKRNGVFDVRSDR